MPDKGRAPPWQSPCAALVRVETTVRQTFDREAGVRKRPVSFKPDRELDSADTWMFTDGGSSGCISLVVLRPGSDARLVARSIRTETRNVGAEVGALVSALKAMVPGERVAIVTDFLWGIYYVLGWHGVENELLREQVAEARAVIEARRPAKLRVIHVKGHVRDTTGLGHWNDIADRLCALRKPVDVTLPIGAFGAPGSRPKLASVLAS